MNKPKKQNPDAKTTITVAIISGFFTIISACIGVLGNLISSVPEVQKLSIPTEAITFITVILSILVLAVVLFTSITTYIRNQANSAAMAIAKLNEIEEALFLEIENETSRLIAEKVQS